MKVWSVFSISCIKTNKVKYYEAGDTINCNGFYSWGNDTLYKLGDYGCLNCYGPWTVADKYFAYTDGVNVSWVKVSFDIMDGATSAPISFSMTEFLTYCNPTSVDENLNESDLVLSPNPTVDGKINIQTISSIVEIEVYNSIGQKVDFRFDEKELTLPEVKGVYIVKIKNSTGRYLSKSVVRK